MMDEGIPATNSQGYHIWMPHPLSGGLAIVSADELLYFLTVFV